MVLITSCIGENGPLHELLFAAMQWKKSESTARHPETS
jgi:hypothetical protein